MSLNDRLRNADPFMAVRWETMRVAYFKANLRGNEQKLEDAQFQLSRWNHLLKEQLGDQVLID